MTGNTAVKLLLGFLVVVTVAWTVCVACGAFWVYERLAG